MSDPLGIFETRLDHFGRLRLPAAFLHALGESTRFEIAALPGEGVRLTPAADPALPAVDASGRFVIPAALRADLTADDAGVCLLFSRGCILVLSQSVMESRREKANSA